MWTPREAAFFGDAIECEERAERARKIEAFINLLAQSEDPNSPTCQYGCAATANLDPNSLTPDEQDYIEREVERRL